MPSIRFRSTIPVPIQIAILALLTLSLAYSLWIGAPLMWVGFVLGFAILALAAFLLYLFYRLVVAVETIAREL